MDYTPNMPAYQPLDTNLNRLDNETHEYEINSESLKPVKPSVAPSEPFSPSTIITELPSTVSFRRNEEMDPTKATALKHRVETDSKDSNPLQQPSGV